MPHTNYLSCSTWFLFNILVFGGVLFRKISDVLCLVTQSCLTVCNPMDCSPPDSSVQGIFQAIILEWVYMHYSRGSPQSRNRTQVSPIAGGFFTIWATREAKEYWSGYPIASQGDLSDPEIEPGSPALQVDPPSWATREAWNLWYLYIKCTCVFLYISYIHVCMFVSAI